MKDNLPLNEEVIVKTKQHSPKTSKHPACQELSSRAAASKIIQECVEAGQSLASLLPYYLEQTKAEHRPLAQEISFGVLRWYYRLNPLLSNMLSKPLRGKKKSLHYLLLACLYQLHHLDKADYAVVKETVNACDELQQSWAKGLVNAILRRFLREKDALLTELDRSYYSRFAYPEWLVNAIKSSWKGIERPVESILDAGNQRPPMTLRINQQFELESYKQMLQENEISFSEPETSLHSYTLVLDKPLSVDKLPLFSEGALSVQDGAPQLAASLLSPQPGDLILDACAAPGGKTMHLFEQQASLKKVVALDVSSERLKRVQENSLRLKIPREKLLLMTADASKQDWWDCEQFDRILLDAPCSATGVIRRHPDIKLLRREKDISALTQLQAQIMDNLWLMLKPGGLLLYATCSIIRDENDRQVEAFLNRQKNSNATELLIEADWGIRMPFGRQILPGEHNMDGFYYALLRKSN
ncbi:MAG: 16S rRNA (cytosine(967)-C(5))-methyltransferase RsmB [gamma proteobacterium symbiont of Lucinoma myriamae]|nr:16S rRNA (cytosine(967)-C(5))-methyltransferase RsmB [gamma proteobacterium symbiont of Lucinoma myriamae]